MLVRSLRRTTPDTKHVIPYKSPYHIKKVASSDWPTCQTELLFYTYGILPHRGICVLSFSNYFHGRTAICHREKNYIGTVIKRVKI